jgi:hypothetical protein
MPAETAADSSWLEVLKIFIQVAGYAVTWSIVFKGWQVTNRQNAKRDERKELRDLVNDIADGIRNTEASVVAYFTSTEGPQVASYWTVHFGVRQVNASIVSCAVFNTDRLSSSLLGYRQAITGGAIQGPQSKLPTGVALDAALRGVSKAGADLTRELESRYRELFPFT